jgi:menaquinone-dependent protoporphyrinogen oxidase
MASRRILIAYGTRYGHTLKIAERIADTLMEDGDTVRLIHAHGRNLPRELSFADFDGVIVGASVIVGRHQRAVRRFVRDNRDRLGALPTAFFSVSGAAGSQKPDDRARAAKYVSEFLAQTGWRPALTDAFGGAMAYTKYNPLLRWITKRESMKEGGPTDTSRDHETTDWAQVERFARAFAATVPEPNVLATVAGT